MAKSMKKMLLLAKVETTAGTDSVPTAALNAILCRAFMPEMITADEVSRDFIRPYKGNGGTLTAGVYRKLTCEVELAGSGTAGTAPAWGPLLKACGFSETVVAVTSVTYDLVSSGEPTLTLYGFIDGIKFVMTNCKGTVSFELNAKSIPVMKYEFIGAYAAATDITMPSDTSYAAFKQPLVVGKVNTPTFTFMTVSACTSAFSINLANALAWRELINCAGPHSPDRKPTGSVTMELPPIATKDWAEAVRLSTTGAAQLIHGTVAGGIIKIDMPAVQPKPFTLQDDQSIAMISMPFDVNPVSGNDELKLTLT